MGKTIVASPTTASMDEGAMWVWVTCFHVSAQSGKRLVSFVGTYPASYDNPPPVPRHLSLTHGMVSQQELFTPHDNPEGAPFTSQASLLICNSFFLFNKF